MAPRELLWWVLTVLGISFALTLLILFGHALWMSLYEARAVPWLERGRRAMAAIAQGDATEEDEAAVQALPARLQVRLFVELMPSLGGSARERLVALARRTGLAARGERLCESRLWFNRLRGVRLLAALGGGDGTVARLFRDPHPAVREEAFGWAADHPTPEIIAALAESLAAQRDAARFALRDSLLRIGPPSIEPLARYLDAHAGEAAEPALDVATGIPDARFAPAALRLCADPVPAVRRRAAALVGAIGGDRAVAALEGMLADPAPEVRAEAAHSLGKLGHWPAAPAVARLLRDRAWAARREAALALRALGSPGLLLLRRALADPDPFAADMARQVLDLPGAALEGGS